MAINKHDQILSTSADYIHALKKVENIEKAVEIIEWWGEVSNFPQFITDYNDLLARVIATTDARPPNSESMRVANRKLTEKLAGLDKRVTAASLKMRVAGPSKELIQMLKVHKEEKKEEKKDDKSKWTWTRIAKYSAAGAVAIIAAPKLLELLPPLFNAGGPSFQLAGSTVKAGGAVLQGAAITLGTAQNELGQFLGKDPIPPNELVNKGASLMGGAGASLYITSLLTNFIVAAIPSFKSLAPYIPPAVLAVVACNSIDSTCTQTITDRAKDISNAIGELGNVHPVGYNAIISFLLLGGTYNKDAIIGFFSATSGLAKSYAGYGAAAWFLAKMIDATHPGFIDAVREKLPSYQDLSATGMTVIDKASEIYKTNPETAWSVFNIATFAGTYFGYVHPAIPITSLALQSDAGKYVFDTAAVSYHNGTLGTWVNAASPIAKDAASWLNQTFNNVTTWPCEKWLTEIKTNYSTEINESFSWGILGYSIAGWLPFIKAGAEAAKRTAMTAINDPAPNTITTIKNVAGAITRIQNTVSKEDMAKVVAARLSAGNSARRNYFIRSGLMSGSLFAVLKQGLPVVAAAVKESCTNSTGYCHQRLEGVGKAWNSSTTGWDEGYLASVYNTVTGNPGTSIASVGFSAGSYGILKHHFVWGYRNAAIASTAIFTLPPLANVFCQTVAAPVSTAMRSVVDAIKDSATTIGSVVTAGVGVAVGAGTALKTPQFLLNAANWLGVNMGPRLMPNAVALRNANGVLYQKVARIVIPIVTGITAMYVTYTTTRLFARP